MHGPHDTVTVVIDLLDCAAAAQYVAAAVLRGVLVCSPQQHVW